MKTILRALVAVFVATSCFAQDVARLDQIVQPYVQNKTFMGSVLVARGGEVILSKGYGSANLEWDVPNTPSTKFRLGSITKQFTAASILLLEERGKLKLDDPIKRTCRMRRRRGTGSRSSICSRTRRGFQTSRRCPNTNRCRSWTRRC
jgi:CubicO group peptidase (beta-lactamase class C family)